VIGLQRPSRRSYWKVPVLNRGVAPVESEDPEVPEMIHRTVVKKKTLVATFTNEALRLADVVIVDVQCDYVKNQLGKLSDGYADMEALKQSFYVIGQKIPPEALILIETTVAPGTTEHVALPIIRDEFSKRGISSPPVLAHSYERVMPGREYVRSIRDFWRVCAGIDQRSRERVVKFLTEVLNTKKFPLTVMDSPIESETTKIMENSWRATILAFMAEWGLYAEKTGVDLVKVVNAIKVRPTHCNILFAGPGVGGYCLPKDGGLGVWAYRNILNFEGDIFKITPLAININDTKALHAADLVEEALKEMGKAIKGARVLILGAAYREDVGDTRYSASELIVRKLTELGAEVSAHDPYVKSWWEFETQDEDPKHSWARFFKNQEKLKGLKIQKHLDAALKGMDVVVFAVRHKAYRDLDPQRVVRSAGKPLAILDCFGVLSDEMIAKYLRLGCPVRAMGRGHIARMKAGIAVKKRKA
jgi:UDP-N-acetyl-D-glucosamine dehydrogenase